MGRPKLTDEQKANNKLDRAAKKKEKEKSVEIMQEVSGEFPQTEISIDVFSPAGAITEKKISDKKAELLERAKKLGEKIDVKDVKTEEIKEQLEKERKTLIPVEDYIKYGVYIGTKVITPHMRPFVYKRRNDGIAILDINKIDTRIKEFMKVLVKYNSKDFIIACKREAGWKAVKKFSELTGVRVFTKKYPAGVLTNSVLPNFFETEMVFVCDPWLDKNAMNDAKMIKKQVLGLCDTNNYTFNVDHFIPCNNKSGKSIGIIFYLLAKEYCQHWKIEKKVELDDFLIEEDQEQ